MIRIYEMVLHELPARLTDLVVTTFGKEPFALRLLIQFSSDRHLNISTLTQAVQQNAERNEESGVFHNTSGGRRILSLGQNIFKCCKLLLGMINLMGCSKRKF